MSETAIKAPKVNHWIFVLKDGKFVFDKRHWKLLTRYM